ncbi:MAG: hypothetical protein J6B50_12360 [Lachnospiraceae bacterium]|nr:hypothetical protein [Lachnospiraceae bacterium]
MEIINMNQRYNISMADRAKQTILSKIDEAIDDLEQERVLSEEELWKELDSL